MQFAVGFPMRKTFAWHAMVMCEKEAKQESKLSIWQEEVPLEANQQKLWGTFFLDNLNCLPNGHHHVWGSNSAGISLLWCHQCSKQQSIDFCVLGNVCARVQCVILTSHVCQRPNLQLTPISCCHACNAQFCISWNANRRHTCASLLQSLESLSRHIKLHKLAFCGFVSTLVFCHTLMVIKFLAVPEASGHRTPSW